MVSGNISENAMFKICSELSAGRLSQAAISWFKIKQQNKQCYCGRNVYDRDACGKCLAGYYRSKDASDNNHDDVADHPSSYIKYARMLEQHLML